MTGHRVYLNITQKETADLWQQLQDRGGFETRIEFVKKLLEKWQEGLGEVVAPTKQTEIDFGEKLEQVLQFVPETREELIKKAVDVYCDSLIKTHKKIVESTPEDLTAFNKPGMANWRIQKAIEAVIRWNDTCEADDRYCITKGVIFSLTGSNRQTIKNYFELGTVKATLAEHHERYGLDEFSNRKPGKSVDGYLKAKIADWLA